MRALIILLIPALLLPVASGARAAPETGVKMWVELPRATQDGPTLDLPGPPDPTPRALARRQARGRPDRVDRLGRGPDPERLRALLDEGVEILYVSRLLSTVSVRATAGQVERLREELGDDRVRPVRSWRRDLPRADRSLARTPSKSGVEDYGLTLEQITQIEVDALHDLGLSGRGVRVLMLDTGFFLGLDVFDDLHVVDQYDFVFDDPITANEPVDVVGQQNHGTWTLSVLAGRLPGVFVSPAHASEVLLAKTDRLDTETRVEEDHFVAALEWGEALGADVVSASLGYLVFRDDPDTFAYQLEDLDGDTAVTTRAMDAVVALGVVAVSAVGNRGSSGASSLMTPSDGDSVLAVGSVREDGLVSTFSSRGPTYDGRIKPDLMARGTQTFAASVDGGYDALTGTSVSTPLVTGVVSLLLEAHPEWGPGEVADALRTTASRSDAPDNDYGWGIVRARAAALDFAPPVHPLPFALESPVDSAVVGGPSVEFRWRRAVDLQTPDALEYEIQLSDDPAFSSMLAVHPAGPDTTRSLSFLPAGPLFWRVRVCDPDHRSRVTVARSLRVESATSVAPRPPAGWFTVSSPFPNPFNPRVTVDFHLDRPARVAATIHDAAGRTVAVLTPRRAPGGTQSWIWEGIDDRGRPVSSGVYLLRAVARSSSGGVQMATRRLVLLR